MGRLLTGLTKKQDFIRVGIYGTARKLPESRRRSRYS